MAAAVEPTEAELAARVPELRDEFLKQYAESLSSGVYDDRDVENVRNNDPYVQCFLRSFMEKNELTEPLKNLDLVLKFRKEIGVNDLTLETFPKEFEEKQFLYWMKGVDNQGRKILKFMVARHSKGKNIEQVKKYITYYLEQHHKANPGVRIVLIFDFTGAGVTNMDLDVTKFIITSLSTYFPSILAYLLLFEMPWLLSSIWKIIRSWLSEEQNAKISLVKKSEIQKYIDADQLEEHMIKN